MLVTRKTSSSPPGAEEHILSELTAETDQRRGRSLLVLFAFLVSIVAFPSIFGWRPFTGGAAVFAAFGLTVIGVWFCLSMNAPLRLSRMTTAVLSIAILPS